MKKLNVPSLQHLARNWHNTPERVSKQLIGLVRNPPTFSYSVLFELVRDLVVLNQPLDAVMKGVSTKIARQDVKENFLELLPLIQRYFDNSQPTFVQSVNGRMYPLARDLMIPFSPPLVYVREGELIFPWFSFWKSNPLSNERLSLFVTVVDEILKQDADLENAVFQILDFSAPTGCKTRNLVITDAKEIPRLSESRKKEMLEVFASGYQLAKQALAETSIKPSTQSEKPQRNDGQADLFGFDL